MFLISLFAILPTTTGVLPWYSPVFASYMLYPLVAALFDKPVFKHMLLGLLQILLIQFIGGYLSKIGFPSFPFENHDILNIIVCVYTIGMASLIVYLIFNENRIVKTQEIERSKQLQLALEKVEISNELIKKQADDLFKLNDSKNKFFSIIAHDLKSPYNTVIGFSEILKDKSINDPEYYKYAKNLYDTALDNYSLLENLLEWARTQMDHIQFRPSEFAINEVIYKTINLVGVSAEKKNVVIKNEISNSIIVSADRTLVSIIIRNILTNAIKFTRPGGFVTIGYVNRGRLAEFFIKDNGIGIPEEMVKYLFKLEYIQSRKGTSSETGTGLGLILCKDFVEMHGGEIWVKSKENEGSTFYFTLPKANKQNKS